MNASRREVFSKTATTSLASSAADNCMASGPLPSVHRSMTWPSPSWKNEVSSRNLGHTGTQLWMVTSTGMAMEDWWHRWKRSVEAEMTEASRRCRQRQSSTENSTIDNTLAIISFNTPFNRLPTYTVHRHAVKHNNSNKLTMLLTRLRPHQGTGLASEDHKSIELSAVLSLFHSV